MRSVELFAGAGGLAMGMSNVGFRHEAVIEWNHYACETFRENQRQNAHSVEGWPLHEIDVRQFDFARLSSGIDVVSGGPPCQPFSLGGKHRGHLDSRDMFPQAVRAVRELRPRAFIVENVKGLMRDTFANYFEYVRLQFGYPSLLKREGEAWRDHYARLEKHRAARRARPEYNVEFKLLNAANYGVPQRRERVFIVGYRADLAIEWAFPEATHSEDALLVSQSVTGKYWERHGVARKHRPQLTSRLRARVERLEGDFFSTGGIMPWVTVRDALEGLPDPEKHSTANVPNHALNPGAKSYPGHTGSPLDEPAKTLKAGDHGVPGGENMLARLDGTVRYFTVREAARLQTFPDNYVFCGSWSEAMRQLGNAIPVKLAELVAGSVAATLASLDARGGTLVRKAG